VATGVQCALCHPGYTNTTVNKPLHVNGVANVQPADLATNCAGCHGDPARVLPPGTPTLVKAAPPVDRNGSSSPAAVGVGAHQGHVLPGANALALPISCDQCHVVPTDLSHVGPLATTPATVIWGSLASANGATPAIAPAAPGSATVTCSNVYCHGGGPGLPLGGGTLTNPSWNPPSAVACGSCHALPGGAVDTSSWHPAVATGADCGLCHTGYTRAFVNLTAHVNGLVDVSSPTITTSCSACHGDSSRAVPAGEELLQAAPPVDRHGSSDTKQVGVGAHQAHLMPGASAIANPIACTECHVVPTDLLHVGPGPNTPATLNWGPLATTGGVDPTFDQVKATCTNYCHGALQTGGSNTSPIWNVVNGTQARCGTCHGNPPTSGVHVQHASPDFYGVSCGVCHPTGYAYGVVGPAAVDVHVNGSVNMNPAGFGNWSGTAAGPSGWKGTATGCHGGTRYWYPGSVPTCQ
jgi:predicted CxxxxCH...CXXCH cytochrome family protein